jgi:hypothetical protein
MGDKPQDLDESNKIHDYPTPQNESFRLGRGVYSTVFPVDSVCKVIL